MTNQFVNRAAATILAASSFFGHAFAQAPQAPAARPTEIKTWQLGDQFNADGDAVV